MVVLGGSGVSRDNRVLHTYGSGSDECRSDNISIGQKIGILQTNRRDIWRLELMFDDECISINHCYSFYQFEAKTFYTPR